MITIQTFLRIGDGKFERIDDCETPPSDVNYIEGAIELTIDGVEIIGQPHWDYVDQLWGVYCYDDQEA